MKTTKEAGVRQAGEKEEKKLEILLLANFTTLGEPFNSPELGKNEETIQPLA